MINSHAATSLIYFGDRRSEKYRLLLMINLTSCRQGDKGVGLSRSTARQHEDNGGNGE